MFTNLTASCLNLAHFDLLQRRQLLNSFHKIVASRNVSWTLRCSGDLISGSSRSQLYFFSPQGLLKVLPHLHYIPFSMQHPNSNEMLSHHNDLLQVLMKLRWSLQFVIFAIFHWTRCLQEKWDSRWTTLEWDGCLPILHLSTPGASPFPDWFH